MHEMHYIATLGHILTTMSTFSGFEACILDTLGHVYTQGKEGATGKVL